MELIYLLYFVYAMLGIGIIIFIHELGHFLAAKRAGVRVEVFSLGFDPTIRGRKLRLLSFRRGETVYSIGAIPFGGYVKMAGETAMEKRGEGVPPQADELVAKPPGARAMVFAAGAAFNIISAFLFFMVAFKIGVNFTAPVIGNVEPGRPAWKAGVRSGDRVVRIDGEEINDFHEIAISSALGDADRPRTFELEREGKRLDPIAIVPAWTPELGFHSIGVTPAPNPEIKGVKKDSPAHAANIREGDRILGLEVDGVVLPGPSGLFRLVPEYLQFNKGATISLHLERPGEAHPFRVEVRPQVKPTDDPRLGVMPASYVVEAIRPGSPTAPFFQTGDRLLLAGGKPVASLDWISVRQGIGLKGPVEIEVLSVRGARRAFQVDAGELIRWDIDRELKWDHDRLRLAETPSGGPFERVLRKGDIVVAVGPQAEPVQKPERFLELISVQENPVRIWRLRDGEVHPVDVELDPPHRVAPGLSWNSLPPVRVLPGTPAAQAGIPSLALITEIDGRPLRSWEDLQSAVKGPPSRAITVRWIDPLEKRETQAVVNLQPGQNQEVLELGVSLGFLQVRVQAGLLESFALGANRTVVVGKDVFLTLKGLIRREVAAKNLAGPVGIIHLISRVSEEGLGTLIYYLALISVNLGLFNLLPFPILDGGHLLFLVIEKIKGSPVDVKVQEIATTVAFFLIIGLALFVTYNDLARLFGR